MRGGVTVDRAIYLLANKRRHPTAAGTWMTAYGMRYGPDFSIELRMKADVEYKIVRGEIWH